MSLVSFEQLLKEMIGLDVESIGASAIERAVKERQHAGRFISLRDYWDWVLTSDTERQSLIEAVVVPETWFFRDKGAFEGLSGFVEREWRPGRPDGVFRLLCVPCSTGEEPYSIAIALQEAGLASGQRRIDAVDVSRRALTKGQLGIFGENSFRGTDRAFRERYFTRVNNGYQLEDRVRGWVNFHHGNLLSPAFLADAEPYDVIFCRNLFIYFDRVTQQHAIAALKRLLSPEGVLFVGSSETGVFMGQEFMPANLPKAFAFRRRERPSRLELPAPESRAKLRPLPVPATFSRLSERGHGSVATNSANGTALVKSSLAAGTETRQMSIDDAYQLADQGHFAEAARCCEEHLRTAPSARVFYLLGLVRDATGNQADAESFYRKALYLDPAHRDSLAHLALLLDRQGKSDDAQVLRNRARRLEAQDRA